MENFGPNKQNFTTGTIIRDPDIAFQDARRSPRIPYYKRVKYGLLNNQTGLDKAKEVSFNGFTLNISKRGIGIEGSRGFPANFKIQARLFTGERTLRFEGIVRWALPTNEGKWRMGIEITSRIDYIKKIHNNLSQTSD